MSSATAAASPLPGFDSEAATRALGLRVRRARTERGQTLLEVSTATGLSVSMLSMLERGKTGISVGSLVAVATALGIAVGDLFETPGVSTATVSTREEQRTITVGEGVTRRLLLHDKDRGIEMAELELPPGSHTGSEPVRHDGNEYLTVVEGVLTVEINGSVHELGPGDAIQLDAQQLHRFANTSEHTSRSTLVLYLPRTYGYGH